MIHHVTVVNETAREIQEARAERHASFARNKNRIAPLPIFDRLSIDRHDFERVGVYVENVIVLMLIDDNPFFHRTKLDTLVYSVRVEGSSAHQKAKFLVVSRRRKFRLNN